MNVYVPVLAGSTALVEACRNRDMGMLDLLLKNHARDDECKALFIAAHAKDEIIVSKLLALKVSSLSNVIFLNVVLCIFEEFNIMIFVDLFNRLIKILNIK